MLPHSRGVIFFAHTHTHTPSFSCSTTFSRFNVKISLRDSTSLDPVFQTGLSSHTVCVTMTVHAAVGGQVRWEDESAHQRPELALADMRNSIKKMKSTDEQT